MSIMPTTLDVHLPNTKQKLRKQNTNAGKFMEKKERKSIQEAIEALDAINPFLKDYSLQNHFDNVISETPGLIIMVEPVGDISANVVFNGAGLGSIVMYRQSDLFLSLHTVQPAEVEPMMPVGGLVELARLTQGRIS